MSINKRNNISSLDTTNVINMSYIFNDCSSLKVLNLLHFNTDNVDNMSYTFLIVLH